MSEYYDRCGQDDYDLEKREAALAERTECPACGKPLYEGRCTECGWSPDQAQDQF